MTFLQAGGTKEKNSGPWRAAAYLRLSKEDGDKPESDSIQNQHRIIEAHLEGLRRQGEEIGQAAVYADDGYSGGSFDRPGYQRMLGDLRAGRVNCLIFKDLSRLGRNYPELGRLLEEELPRLGVRVISVLNGLDSLRQPEGFGSSLVSFHNVMNDDYIRQLSHKIRCTLDMKRRRGEFIGNYAPYGYAKSPEDRHVLVVDPEAARVVQTIFQWYAAGLSASGVAQRLSALGVPTPSAYKAAGGCSGFAGRGSGAWSPSTVGSILRNEVYLGNLVQGKRKSVSYRTKQMAAQDQSQWFLREGAHEAIISDALFTLVHERLSRHTRSAGETVYPLSGLVVCGSCGRRMTRCVSSGRARFRCPTRAREPGRCAMPSLPEERLEAAVLAAAGDRLATGALPEANWDSSAALEQAQREAARLEEALFRLYDDFRQGRIDEEEFSRFRERYRARLRQRRALAERLRPEEPPREKPKGLDRAAAVRLVDHILVRGKEDIQVVLRSDVCFPPASI